LKTLIDQVLEELKSDGTYDDIMKRRFPVRCVPALMPVIELTRKTAFSLILSLFTQPFYYLPMTND
jgi:hypothetical protein